MGIDVTRTPRSATVREAAPAVPTAPSARRRRPGGARWAAWAFLAPVVVYLIAFYAYPLYRNVELSLREYTVRSFVQGGAPFAGLDNYRAVLAAPTFPQALLNTLVFTVTSLVCQFAVGLLLALFFHRHFPLSRTLRALFLVPWLLPLIVSASTWSWLLNSEASVVNAGLALVGADPVNWLTSPRWSLVSVIIANIWIGIPFNLVVLYSGLQAIPRQLHEAAELDGAGGWQRFRWITWPLLRPVSAITLLLGLVYTLKVFDLIWIMTRGGPTDSSTTLATWSYRLGFGNLLPEFGSGAAVGNLLILLAVAAGGCYIGFEHRRRLS
ncbi:carbohydrate ABC transporter permease [Micromonospora andamanensis]|uniref:Sugar ABC transporter permease n=1 Tax=Micromonospora andamanensis TaxID=1287068 RepID=A0ABQ4HYZ2_9ACTN|nr:sugar ABC transporter permease [Micromonospora andamanensis]GIJ10869.1 sugar ABC transporter permease [Micromonospora andamanensis]